MKLSLRWIEKCKKKLLNISLNEIFLKTYIFCERPNSTRVKVDNEWMSKKGREVVCFNNCVVASIVQIQAF